MMAVTGSYACLCWTAGIVFCLIPHGFCPIPNISFASQEYWMDFDEICGR